MGELLALGSFSQLAWAEVAGFMGHITDVVQMSHEESVVPPRGSLPKCKMTGEPK